MAISWAAKKQLTYLLFALVAVAGLIAAIWLNITAPSCTDGKQNQDEQGIDCGGVCAKECLGK